MDFGGAARTDGGAGGELGRGDSLRGGDRGCADGTTERSVSGNAGCRERALTATATYFPATELKSVSIFDYWSPETAVQRLLSGAGVDQMEILINGDYHEFHFRRDR